MMDEVQLEESMSMAPATVPFSREAEEGVLGSILINPDAYYDVAGFLSADDFYIHRHGWVWSAILRLQENHIPLDMLTVCEELDRANRMAEIGGSAFITALINQSPSSLNAEAYGRIVEAHSTRRRMINAANQIASLAYDRSIEIASVTERSVAALEKVVMRETGSATVPLSDCLNEAYDRIDRLSKTDELPGIPTGLFDLDRKLGNLQRATLYIVAGRPGQGKTSLKRTIARNAAIKGFRVAIFSLEMSNEKLTNRLLAQETGMDVQLIDTGKIGEEGWDKITAGIGRMEKYPIFLDDTPAISPLQLKAKCRRLMMAHGGLDLVIVDYLQLMTANVRTENRTQEVGFLSRSLKALSKELDVPVLAGAQLSRAVEQRADKRPQLSDLRESGDIEADADVVMFLYQTGEQNQDHIQPTDVIVAKHRNGPDGDVKTLFFKSCVRFQNAAKL
jgi:replicative DNA helicase